MMPVQHVVAFLSVFVALVLAKTRLDDQAVDQVLEFMTNEKVPDQAEECIFSCKENTSMDTSQLSSVSGCASFGVQLNTGQYDQVDKCCTEHDKCYRQCNISKKGCDESMKKCISHHDKDIGHMFYLFMEFYGCDRYKITQHIGCNCPNDTE